MQQVKAKKSLGQHFLTDLSVAKRIADTMAGYTATPLLEVGPGMGVLTRFLLDARHDLKVVELDSESVEYLGVNFPDLNGVLRDWQLSLQYFVADFLQSARL